MNNHKAHLMGSGTHCYTTEGFTRRSGHSELTRRAVTQ